LKYGNIYVIGNYMYYKVALQKWHFMELSHNFISGCLVDIFLNVNPTFGSNTFTICEFESRNHFHRSFF
jgi:hypothetical protein